MWFLVWTRLKATARGFSLHAAVALVLWASLTVVGTLYLLEDVILFRPLPVSGRDRLFRVEFESSGSPVPVSAADVRGLATQLPPGIDAIAGVRTSSCPIEADGIRAIRTCATVTPGFFHLFGMSFGLDDRQSANDVVVSDSFRQKALAGQPAPVGGAIIGTQFDFASLQPRDQELRIRAIAPRGFRVPGATEVWRLPPHSESRMGYMHLWVRTLSAAPPPEAALTAMSARLPGAGGQRLLVRSLADAMTPKEAWPLLVLLAVSAAIVLAGWVHAATLLAVRAYGRSTTIATKLALGASPRHLVLESATDGFAVAAVSWLLSQPATALAVGYLSASLPFLEHKHVEYRTAAAAVTALAALIGWLGFVALAVLVLARRLSEIRGRKGRRRSWEASVALLAGSYCLTTGVLYVAATVALSYGRTVNRDFGFDTARLIGVSVAPTPTGDWQEAVRTTEQLLRSSRSVTLAASLDGLPFFYVASQTVTAGGRNGTLRATPAVVRRGGAGLLRTMGVRLLAGRDLREGDEQKPAAAVLSRSLAATLFPDGEVLGRTVSVRHEEHRVVGVCADIVDDPRNTDDPGIQLYVGSADTTDFLARTASGTWGELSKLAEELEQRAPGVLITTISYDEQRTTLAKGERAAAQLVGFVLLASIAVATLGFNAGMLTALRENLRTLAVRLALGASPRRVILPSVRPHVLAALMGSVVGVVAAVDLTSLVRSMVPRIERVEPYAIVLCGLVTLLSMFASLPQALRVVSRSDILTILNKEG